MITMMSIFNLQASDRGLRGDDALWQLLRGPGAHGKLHQQHRHLLRREYLHKVRTSISVWENNRQTFPLLLLYFIKTGMSIPDLSDPHIV